MSFSTTHHENDFYSFDDLFNADNVPDTTTHDDILALLRKHYPDDFLEDEVDESKAANDPEYVIKTHEECGYDDSIFTDNYFHLHLPNDEVAKELASILYGDVIEGLHDTDRKRFRITFRSEIFISANSEEEAREKFWEMELYSREASDNGAAFVELNTVDECL